MKGCVDTIKALLSPRGLINFWPQEGGLIGTFVLIVSAHPYCTCNLGSVVMPRHALSACAVEEI